MMTRKMMTMKMKNMTMMMMKNMTIKMMAKLTPCRASLKHLPSSSPPRHSAGLWEPTFSFWSRLCGELSWKKFEWISVSFGSFVSTKRGQHKLLCEHFWMWQMNPLCKTHVNHKIHEMDHNEENLGRHTWNIAIFFSSLELGHLCDHKYIVVRVRDQIALHCIALLCNG